MLMGLLIPDQLSCDNQPFFEALPPRPTNIKIFYDKVLSAEGNIFEACTVT